MGDGAGSVFGDSTTPGNCVSNALFSKDLRPIEEVPHRYRAIFSDYACFNYVQSAVFDDLFYTDQSMVISAPTGSGKTTIFELGIVRALIAFENTKYENNFKIVYISPMKALCEERLVDWYKKFAEFGVNCISITGDSDNVEFRSLLNHNLIITTPEKWDSLTRKWRDNQDLVELVKLFMIDEVHLLNENNRGSTLETIVCRMKTIQETVEIQKKNSENNSGDEHKIRFIAVSATISNIVDIAEWFGKLSTVKYFKFSDDVRPVKLKKIVLGYPYHPKSTPFKFDFALNYKLQDLVMQYSQGKPTLIFCSTRKIVEMTAKHILKNLTINLNQEQKLKLVEAVKCISDFKIKETLIYGIGYHHAGMMPETKRTIENIFRNGDLPILVTTSTLAMGVNLPAHLVIIKSTKCYHNGQFCDYTETAILQMIGRAGRPQFDTTGTALILTTLKDKSKFEKMVGGSEPVESNLHKNLTEHLNAEVVLRTITDLGVAMRWLSSTYLYIRARKNPKYYGLSSGLTPQQIDKKLLEMCQIELNKLVTAKMLTINQDVVLEPTLTGIIMAKYYLAFETMRLFTQVTGEEVLQQILMLIAKCHEFSEMYLRVNDKKCLNLLNKCKNGQTIRFPLNGKIKTLDMKINCLIQAVLGCLDICDHSLLSETLRVMRNAERITKALIEYLESRTKCYRALLNIITLAKCFTSKLWENSPYVSKQLNGIGAVMSAQMVKAGKISFDTIQKTDARELEMIINKKPPMGDRILDQVKYLPKYSMKIERDGAKRLKLLISLENAPDLENKCTINVNSVMYLLVGNSDNYVIIYEKYTHSYMIERPNVTKTIDLESDVLEEVEANFISEDWAGIDCNIKFVLISKEVPPKCQGKKKTTCNNNKNYMQSFLEKYNEIQKRKEINLENQKKINVTEGENRKIVVHSIDVLNNNIEPPAKSCSDNVFVMERKSNDRASTSKLSRYSSAQFDKIIDSSITRNTNTEQISSVDKIENLSEKMLEDMDDIGFDNSIEFNVDSEEMEVQSSETFTERGDDVSMHEPDELIKSPSPEQTVPAVMNYMGDAWEDQNYKENVNPITLKDPTESKIGDNSTTPERVLQSMDNSNNEISPTVDVQKYRYTPHKKFSHLENMLLQPTKKVRTDQDGSAKKISWRTPLVYSPPVKFSPKSKNPELTSKNIENSKNNNNSSQENSISPHIGIQEATTSKYTKTRTSNVWPFAKLTPTKSGTAFPLSDKDCLESSVDEENASTPKAGTSQNSLQQIKEVCSTMFLELTGLVKAAKKETPEVKSPNASSYYSQFMSPSKEKNIDLNKLITSIKLKVSKNLKIPKSSPFECKTGSSNESGFETSRVKPRKLISALGSQHTSSNESNGSNDYSRFHPYASSVNLNTQKSKEKSPIIHSHKKLGSTNRQEIDFQTSHERNIRNFQDYPTYDDRPSTSNRYNSDKSIIETEHNYGNWAKKREIAFQTLLERDARGFQDYPTYDDRPSTPNRYNSDKSIIEAEHNYGNWDKKREIAFQTLLERDARDSQDYPIYNDRPSTPNRYNLDKSVVMTEHSYGKSIKPVIMSDNYGSKRRQESDMIPGVKLLAKQRSASEESYEIEEEGIIAVYETNRMELEQPKRFVSKSGQISVNINAKNSPKSKRNHEKMYQLRQQRQREAMFGDLLTLTKQFSNNQNQFLTDEEAFLWKEQMFELNRDISNRTELERQNPKPSSNFQNSSGFPQQNFYSGLSPERRESQGRFSSQPTMSRKLQSRLTENSAPIMQNKINIRNFQKELERQRSLNATKPHNSNRFPRLDQSFVRSTIPSERLLISSDSNLKNDVQDTEMISEENFLNPELQISTSSRRFLNRSNQFRGNATETDGRFIGNSSRQYPFEYNDCNFNCIRNNPNNMRNQLDVSNHISNTPQSEPLGARIRRQPEMFTTARDKDYAYAYMRDMMDRTEEDEGQAFKMVPVPLSDEANLENNSYVHNDRYGIINYPSATLGRGPRSVASDCLSESTLDWEELLNEDFTDSPPIREKVQTCRDNSFLMNKFLGSMDDDDNNV